MAALFLKVFQAFFPVDSDAEKENDFLDAWIFASTGQG